MSYYGIILMYKFFAKRTTLTAVKPLFQEVFLRLMKNGIMIFITTLDHVKLQAHQARLPL